jgi:serine/threonine protein kinase
VLAYYACTGKFPFEGDLAGIEKQIREAAPPTPIQLGAGVLRNTQAVLMSCLEKQPNRRPSMDLVAKYYAEATSLYVK